MERLKQVELEGNEHRLRLWVERIRECRTSGLAVNDWCRQNGFTRQAYYYWMRKLKREFVDALPEHNTYEAASIIPVEKPAPPIGWTICEAAEEKTIFKKCVTVKVGKCQVDVTPESDIQLLSNILRVLVAL